MFTAISEFWTKYDVWNKLYIGYAAIILLIAICFIIGYFKKNPKKCLDFITNAAKNQNVVIGKLSCMTLRGYGHPQSYQLEYLYYVDGKKYFVTYEMSYITPIDKSEDETNADMLLRDIQKVLPLYYDKKRPKKVLSKYEVFTSSIGLRQIRTPKKNIWRDVNRDWQEPINLVTI